MTTKQKTCKERIEDELRDRMLEISEALNKEEKREEFEQGILSIDKTLCFKVCLSWGGPADYFNIYVNPDTKEIERIIYQFQDWFDNAEIELSGDDFDKVSQMFNYLTEI